VLKALALALLPGLLPAFGGTQVTWLGGTLPVDTVPYLEADPKLGLAAGTGAPALQAALDLGITDFWMLQGDWSKPLDGGASDGQALSRLRFPGFLPWGFGAAFYGGAVLPEGLSADAFGGVIAGWEGADQAIHVNKALYRSGAQSLHVGYWAPYPLYFLRPGLEFGLDDLPSGGSRAWWLPQLALNFPGDLSFDLGARIAADGSGAWRVLSRVSYQLFPNP
jgi:hypothetical protein